MPVATDTFDLSLTRTQAANLCRLSPRQFDEAIRPRIEEQYQFGDGRNLRFEGHAVVAALVQYRVVQAAPKPSFGDDVDAELMAGGDSPGLERYRNAKADLAEMDRDVRRGHLVPMAELEPVLTSFASVIRGTGDNLQRKFGPDAAEMLNAGVSEAVGTIESFLSDVRAKSDTISDSSNGDVDDDAAPANDARVRRGRTGHPRR